MASVGYTLGSLFAIAEKHDIETGGRASSDFAVMSRSPKAVMRLVSLYSCRYSDEEKADVVELLRNADLNEILYTERLSCEEQQQFIAGYAHQGYKGTQR
jgi:hypothetical protein